MDELRLFDPPDPDYGVAEPPPDRWEDDAACRESENPDLWFPSRTDDMSRARAQRICQSCPVRQACLDQAIWDSERFGIWGGLTYRDRLKHARRLHGTLAVALGSGCRCGPCGEALQRRADAENLTAAITAA